MLISIYKSKIHRATITEVNLNYEGSVTIDEELMEAANILPNEKVQALNLSNGARFESYAIRGKKGSGEIILNGAAARLGQVGDKVIILTYALVSEDEAKKITPKLVRVDSKNKIIE